ncbi:MAG: TIGR03862 family flavoprotein [Rhodocyclaceae bacterium]
MSSPTPNPNPDTAVSHPEPAPHQYPASTCEVAIIGGGPAGLMAAETLAARGRRVDVFDAMPSLGRKFLLAGIGGLNLTHAEPFAAFVARYGTRCGELAPPLEAFGADALRAWAHGLGVETFVGSSGRVFPREMKAAPLLRAWLQRLRANGVRMHARHRWLGWHDGDAPTTLRFATPAGEQQVRADAVVLALGGGSWARLGSDGAWIPWLTQAGVDIAPLRPANCGFEVAPTPAARAHARLGADTAASECGSASGWSTVFRDRFAGQPLKGVGLAYHDPHGEVHVPQGECVITAAGLEGSLIYAHAARLRDAIARDGSITLTLDLAPGRSLARLQTDLARPRGSRSWSSHLQGKTGLSGVKAGLLRECAPTSAVDDPAALAAHIKALPVVLARARPLDEAISTAGGVRIEALDAQWMLRAVPDVFCCGEMLDWEAPTGGYLLTACFATGRAAGEGVARWLSGRTPTTP